MPNFSTALIGSPAIKPDHFIINKTGLKPIFKDCARLKDWKEAIIKTCTAIKQNLQWQIITLGTGQRWIFNKISMQE